MINQNANVHLNAETNHAIAMAALFTPQLEEKFGGANYFFAPLIFAHRALAAAAILARPAALILRRFFGTATDTGLVEEPNSW